MIVASSGGASTGQERKSSAWSWQSTIFTEPGAKRGAEVPAGHTIGDDGDIVTSCTQSELLYTLKCTSSQVEQMLHPCADIMSNNANTYTDVHLLTICVQELTCSCRERHSSISLGNPETQPWPSRQDNQSPGIRWARPLESSTTPLRTKMWR